LNWVLGPFVHGRLQNLQTNEVTSAHVITPLKLGFAIYGSQVRVSLPAGYFSGMGL